MGLIGNKPNQVPTNADLGTMAYEDADYFRGNSEIDTVGTVTSGNIKNSALATSGRATIRPGLLLDFAKTKTLDPRITYSRASIGTYTGENGLVKIATSGQARFDHNPITGESLGLLIEEQRVNLLTYSEQFDNAAWAKSGTTITANAAIAPDGTTTADKVVENTGLNADYALGQSTPTTINTAYTLSTCTKAAGKSRVLFELYGSGGCSVLFDVVNGAVVSSGGAYDGASELTYGIFNLGNGWFRPWISVKTASSGSILVAQIRLLDASGNTSYTGDGTSGIYIWGAQLEVGAFATSYIPSNDTFISRASSASFIGSNGLIQSAATNVARYNYNRLNLALPPKLLLEPTATNLLTYSENFDHTLWTKNNATITANAATAPDGTTTADKLIEDTTNTSHYAEQAVSVINGTSYTFSVYAKSGERPGMLLGCYLGASFTARFNLNAGIVSSVSSGTTANITPMNNGWYKCSITMQSVATGTGWFDYYVDNGTVSSYTGDGTSGIYLWGAQLEVGTSATSYISTAGTFVSRASIGTYTGWDGLIRIAAANTARNSYIPTNLSLTPALMLEGTRTNLLTYSVNFDKWTNGNSYLSLNSAVAPDGTYTACKLIEGSDNIARAHTNVSANPQSFTGGAWYTRTVYAKAAERNYIILGFGQDAAFPNYEYGLFNLSTGLATVYYGTPLVSMTPVGNGWYRCSITKLASANASNCSVDLQLHNGTTNVYIGNGKAGVYIWGAQLEEGAFPTSYIPSNDTFTSRASTGTFVGSNGFIQSAAANVARYNYNPNNLGLAPKLLLEPAATNLLTYSEDQSNGIWTSPVGGLTITNSTAISPDGGMTADTLDHTNTSDGPRRQDVAVANNSFPYTFSVYVKQGTAPYTSISIAFTGGTTQIHTGMATVRWSDLTIGNRALVLGSSITPAGNGWYRFSITVANNSTGNIYATLDIRNQGDGSIGFGVGTENGTSYIWGAQLETGYSTTSYIPTTSAQVTRSADVSSSAQYTRAIDVSTPNSNVRAADISNSAQSTRAADSTTITGTNFSSWYRQDEGTVFAKADSENTASVGNEQFIFGLSDGSGNNTLRATRVWASNRFYGLSAGATQFDLSGGTFTTNQVLLSCAYKLNDIAASFNGATVLTDATALIPTISQINLGGWIGSGYLNGHIAKLAYYPKRLSKTELQGLTTT
jgi:hypothetical protein